MARVIVNRRARGLQNDSPVLAEIRRPRKGIEIVETSSMAELEGAARDAPPMVVLAGGDGSVMAGVTALGARGQIALLPGGTMSTIAQNLTPFGRDPLGATRRLLDAIAAGQTRSRPCPTIRVNERIGFIFGTGLVTRFFEHYINDGAGGTKTAARIVAQTFGGSFFGGCFFGGTLARSILTPTPCAITIDGSSVPFDVVSLLCAGVVRNLGLGMRLLYRAGGPQFHVVGSPLPPYLLGPQMPLVFMGRPLRGPRIDQLAQAMTIRFESAKHTYVLDGELLDGEEIEVGSGPTLSLVTI